MRKLFACLAAVLLVLWTAITPVFAAPFFAREVVSLGYSSWDSAFSGDVKVGEPGDTVDFVNDLNIKSEKINQFNLDFHYGRRSTLYLGYFNVTNAGSGTLTRSFIYDNQTYTIGETVNSEIDQTVVDFINGFALTTHPVKVELLTGIKYFDMNAKLDGSSSGLHEGSVSGPVPVIGIGLQFRPSRIVSFGGAIHGIDVDFSGIKAQIYDYQYGVTIRPSRFTSLSAGYHRLHIEGEDAENAATLNHEGNYFRFDFRF